MTIRYVVALGGLFLLIGSGCISRNDVNTSYDQEGTGTTVSDQVPSATEQTESETHMELAHPGVLPDEKILNKQVRIQTEKGDIVFKLYGETAPLAVSNFVYLAEQGYYDGIIFHRVEPDFVIQGGDPSGTGRGGPGYRFEDELGVEHIPAEVKENQDASETNALYQKGLVAMANAGPNTNGSQFFIMLGDIPVAYMPNLYSIFGDVLEGQDVVDRIEVGDVMTKVTVETIAE